MTSTLRISAALAGLLLAGAASADLRLSQSGIGDAVYVPHFTVEDGQVSLLSVSNHADVPTAARIVLTESLNGRETLYFDVFLPAHSTWSAAIGSDGTGATLTVAPRTPITGVCAVPEIPAEGVPLRPFAYTEPNADGGPTTLARTRTGTVEVIERGRLLGALGEQVRMRNCNAVAQAFANGASPAESIGAPAGGLRAFVDLIDVEDGRAMSVDGISIEGFSTVSLGANLNELPPLRLARPPLAPGATEHVAVLPQGRLAFAADRGPDAVSSLFMAQAIEGVIHSEPELAASTRWAVSFPTKHAYVSRGPGHLATGDQAVPPFAALFGANGSCETLHVRYFSLNGMESVFSPPRPQILCAQSNVLEFTLGITGSNRLNLTGDGRVIRARRLDDGASVTLSGLPAVGVQLSNFVNQNARPGVLGNYSVVRPLVAVPSAVEAAD